MFCQEDITLYKSKCRGTVVDLTVFYEPPCVEELCMNDVRYWLADSVTTRVHTHLPQTTDDRGFHIVFALAKRSWEKLTTSLQVHNTISKLYHRHSKKTSVYDLSHSGIVLPV